MSAENIFSTKLTSRTGFTKVRTNREYLMTQSIAENFNTYSSFPISPMFGELYIPSYEKKGNEWVEVTAGKKINASGVRSLFNRSGGLPIDSNSVDQAGNWRISNNTPLLDSPDNRKKIRELSRCTIKDLVQASQQGTLGREIYQYSDFMYCRYLGKIPNNQLITLRRFPYPVDDYISTMGISTATRRSKSLCSQNSQCVGEMVTWLGTPGNEIDNILKYTVKMPFENKKAEWHQSGTNADKGSGILNSVANMFDATYREQYSAGMAGGNQQNFFSNLGIKGQGANPYSVSELSGFVDSNKVYGPVDAVKETYKRSEGGLEFAQSFSLQFDYELRAYNGINGKQAMLDLLANILAVTYSTGTFWGGGYRGGGAHQNNIFANMEIFKTKGGFTDFADAFSKDVSTLTKSLKSTIQSSGGLLNTIKSALNSIGGMLIGGALNSLGRPDKAMANSLLSPAPIGFWHVTIGNPFHPIMSIGNMVITNCEIKHHGPLGLDDFPSLLTVTVTLDRGKSRDSRDIEKLYNMGNDRIYYSWGEKIIDVYQKAQSYQQNKNNNKTTASSYSYTSDTADSSISNSQNTNSTMDGTTARENSNMFLKYFGDTDAESIIISAKEQEYGSGKKKKSS